MEKNILILFYIFLVVLKLSKQDECFTNGYNISNIKSTERQEFCKAFTYQFNNTICYYNNSADTCLNITEDSLKNYLNYSLAEVPNNCGTAGFFEPLNKESCLDIPLVDAKCCFVIYYNDTEKENHTACLRTKEFKKKDDEKKYLIKHVESFGANFKVSNAECKELKLKCYYNILIIFLILLI